MDTSVATTLLQRLQEALAYIPLEEKFGLMEALQTAPQLVQLKSDPLRFLLASGGHALTAAQCLCHYWNERKHLFPGPCAFWPLSVLQTDSSSLLLQRQQPQTQHQPSPQTSSSSRILATDVRGASVLWYESKESARNLFFLLQKMSENTALHLVAKINPSSRSAQSREQQLTLVMAQWRKAASSKAQAVHIHVGGDDTTILYSLRQYGICLDQLPGSRSPLLSDSSSSFGSGPRSDSASHSSSSPRQGARDASPTLTSAMTTAAALSASSALTAAQAGTDSQFLGLSTWAAAAASNGAHSHAAAAPERVNTTSFPEDTAMRRQGLIQLYEAVNLMPEHQKAAYLEAQRVCPQLVQIESDPIKFLRFHQYNAWSAAQRITTYWTKRKEIFKERAFLPMNMTGDGAMNQEDITFLRSGYFCFLPKDRDGRTVICYDPSRRVDHAKECRMRIGFYFWSIICENDVSISDGYVGIVLLGNGSFRPSSLDGAIRECTDIVIDCFPATTKDIHLVQTIRPSGSRRSLLQMLLPLILQLMGRILENSAVPHVSESPDEMVEEFTNFGLEKDGLPVSAGGTWEYDLFYQWQMERCRLERQRYNNLGQIKQKQEIQVTTTQATAPTPATAVPSSSFSAMPSLTLSGITPSSLFFVSGGQQTNPENAIVQLDYNIRRLPQSEGAAYMEACERAPALVRDESPPDWFSTHASGDVRVASRRLAAYWKLRKELFGDKAFLPMAQTGEGTLGRKDLNLLSTGFFTVLPTKSNQKIILSYDCAKDDLSDEKGRLRVAFYVLSLAVEREISRTTGCCIVASGLNEIGKVHREGIVSNATSFQSLLDVLPVRVAGIHVAMLLQPNIAYPLDESVQAMRRLFGTAGTSKCLGHVGTSRDEIAEQLVPYGIEQYMLPRMLGGSFGYDRFTQWQELRIRYEWGLPAGAHDQDAVEIYDFSKVIPLSSLTEDERKERKRRMNVVHSRRKRERERIEIEVLQEQCDELRDRQVVLTEENERLVDLVRRAQEVVQNVGSLQTAEVQSEERKLPPAVLPGGKC